MGKKTAVRTEFNADQLDHESLCELTLSLGELRAAIDDVKACVDGLARAIRCPDTILYKRQGDRIVPGVMILDRRIEELKQAAKQVWNS